MSFNWYSVRTSGLGRPGAEVMILPSADIAAWL